MPKIKSNPVERMFFKYDIHSNESTCQILNCANPVRTGNHSGNLESHIKNFHKEQYILLTNEKNKKHQNDDGRYSTAKVSSFNFSFYEIN